MRWAKLRETAVLNRKELAAHRSPRKLLLDSQIELQSLLSKVAKNAPRSKYLAGLHAKMMTATTTTAVPLLEQLESEIRPLPSPCARKHIEAVLETMEKVLPVDTLDAELRECLTLLVLQRKLPLASGKRGTKAVPVVASGLWHQVLQANDHRYLRLEGYHSPAAGINYPGFEPQLLHLVMVAATSAGAAANALQASPPSTVEMPTLAYCNPVAFWLETTFVGNGDESFEKLPMWCASVTLQCKSTEECLELLRQLTKGVEAELNGEMLSLTLLKLHNRYDMANAHPAHLRSMSLHVLVTGDQSGSEPFLIEIEHEEITNLYNTSLFNKQYDFFWERIVLMTQTEFERKLESLLVFLVEAISVPVLLSLLLLTYSSTSSSKGITMDLDELPSSRNELYKLGIASGIRKRMIIELNQISQKDQKAADNAQEEAATEAHGNSRKVKRKSTLEQNLGNAALGGGGGGKDDDGKKAHASNEPVIDLNSILRGKKVRVVSGADDVAECYSLVVRVLVKHGQPGFDLRSGIVAVVPKSHSLHGVVTAFVEYVLTPPSRTDQAWQEVRMMACLCDRCCAINDPDVLRARFVVSRADLQEDASAPGRQQPGERPA